MLINNQSKYRFSLINGFGHANVAINSRALYTIIIYIQLSISYSQYIPSGQFRTNDEMNNLSVWTGNLKSFKACYLL